MIVADDSDVSTGVELDLADATTLHWEKKLVQTMLDFNANISDLSILVNVARR